VRGPQHHGVGRPRVGPFPKLSEIRCFCSFSRFWRAHRACRCGCRGGRDTPMGGGDGGINGCVVSAGALGVSRPQKPNFSPIWVEKRLRNGSGTARDTAVFRPRSRPALLPEVRNDRGELHCHRTRHRGGRALPVPGCPQGRIPRRRSTKIIYIRAPPRAARACAYASAARGARSPSSRQQSGDRHVVGRRLGDRPGLRKRCR
jgi:hypothetical protein